MAMSPPVTIAILSVTGILGPSVLQAIAEHPRALDVRIRVLTRPMSAEKAHTIVAEYPTLYLTVHAIDYAGEGGGEPARGGFGLLPGFIAQDAVARAAKAAGVRLFVPSEFGAPTHSMPLDSENYILGKRYHHDLLRRLELPYLLVYTGMLPQTEPAPTPLPPLTAAEPIPLGQPPFETTRYHVATYLMQLLLDRGVEAVAGGIYVIRGLRRDRGIVSSETGKTEWVLDV
ncbi:NAD(P)-binding protein [Mycena venus]|uniref:NAD(P)-binding protein n=1 Tax=Mycena venus TaxID=2733690 RepID=A0A8H6XHX4_9AGAR|nr:NAD(P)-binding protein [Mycena venus]